MFFLAVSLSSLAGCAKPNWISAPNVPNPVLLGPVDRVGGHRTSGGRLVGKIDSEAFTEVSGHADHGLYVRDSAVAANPISASVNAATKRRRNVDVRIDDLDAGGYVFFALGVTTADKWVDVDGRAITQVGAK